MSPEAYVLVGSDRNLKTHHKPREDDRMVATCGAPLLHARLIVASLSKKDPCAKCYGTMKPRARKAAS